MTDMVAMEEIAGVPKDTSAVAVSASAPVSIIGLMILVSLPNIPFVRRRIPSPIAAGEAAETPDGEAPTAELNVAHMAGALALSAAIC